jgi:hypothetical protein
MPERAPDGEHQQACSSRGLFRPCDYRRSATGAQALLVAYFLDSKTSIGRNDTDESVCRIARQANLMKPLPDTDASIGRLQGGGLLFELFLPAPRSLGLLMSNSRAEVRDRLCTDWYPRGTEITHISVLRHDLLRQITPTR